MGSENPPYMMKELKMSAKNKQSAPEKPSLRRRMSSRWNALPRPLRITLRVIEYTLAVYVVLSVSGCWFLTHPKGRAVREVELPDGTEFVDIELKSSDGMRLAGWYLPNMRAVGGAVVCHGWQVHRMAVLDRAIWLRNRGLAVVLFDFRGHGSSERTKCSLGEYEARDVAAGIDYMMGALPPTAAKKVVLWGHSMGAVASLKAAVGRDDVWRVIAEAPFDNMSHSLNLYISNVAHLPPIPLAPTICWLARRHIGLDEPVNVIPDCRMLTNTPVFLLTGGRDRMVSAAMGNAIMDALAGPKERFIVPEGTHNHIFDSGGPKLETTLEGFLALKSLPVPEFKPEDAQDEDNKSLLDQRRLMELLNKER
ncbi:MAG TPA: alpha/beta hydrolase [Candidatus Brocadiia bacterium]|nr:alpha/beta hydrolase [Candidatus Brocadiia bacterium]